MKFSEPGQLEGWEWKLRFDCPCMLSTRIWTYCVPSVSVNAIDPAIPSQITWAPPSAYFPTAHILDLSESA
jgi:hypothetical protein